MSDADRKKLLDCLECMSDWHEKFVYAMHFIHNNHLTGPFADYLERVTDPGYYERTSEGEALAAQIAEQAEATKEEKTRKEISDFLFMEDLKTI